MSPWEAKKLTSYVWMHKKLGEVLGPAITHRCVDCNGIALDWSHRHGSDPDELSSYDPRCRSCHMLYDGHTRGSNHPMSKLDESDVLAIRAKHATGNYKHRELAEIYGVNRRTITEIVNRVKWQHV